MIKISDSVGKFGRNNPDDVIKIQQLLLQQGLTIGQADGRCGPRTIAGITTFQAGFLRLPDGLVEPAGKTIERLNMIGFKPSNTSHIAPSVTSLQAIDYFYLGPYERNTFLSEFIKEFSSSPNYSSGMIPNLIQISNFIGNDSKITDVRWAAYILATTMWETTCLKTEEVINKKGKLKKVRRWVHTMSPVEEVGHGKGRKYHEPVKVKLLSDGIVRITEHDGDQFKIKSDGTISPLKKGAKMGAKDGGLVSSIYTSDDGVEREYFGRGYVQLTWWSNYAKASISLGKGFDLLFDPDLVKNPEIAYKLMSYGMRTGEIFANGRSFSKYFSNKLTDYEGARAMVNGNDHARDIADIARKFETILIKSKVIKQTTLPISAGGEL